MKKILLMSMTSLVVVTPLTTLANNQNSTFSSSLTPSSFIEEYKNNWVLINKSPDNYILFNAETDEKITDVYETLNGVSTKLTAEEALEKFNNIKTIDSFNINSNNNTSSEVSPKSEYIFRKTYGPEKVRANFAQKLSRDVRGPATITISETFSSTVNESFSADLNFGEKIKVRAGAGFSWTQSVTSGVSNTHQVPSGRVGYVAFKPYFNYIKGNIFLQLASGAQTGNKFVEALSPRKLVNGICDGLEYVQLY